MVNPETSLNLADSAAAKRGVVLTDTRREVFGHILAASQPLTAYQLLDLLQRARGRSVMPPTIYRAINFLVENGFVHRLESLNAFVACCDMDHKHSGQFVICNDCGRTQELADSAIHHALDAKAEALGYKVSQQIIELRGTCGDCVAVGL